jgi:AraC-like DNA-binding protein
LWLETGRRNFTADQLLDASLVELADELGCKPRELNQLFQRRFGMSLVALRMELRLLKAAVLLRESNATVGEIAELCGFGHVGLFGVCFERRFESTPMQWRQRNGASVCRHMPPCPPKAKHETPNTKLQRSPKLQAPNRSPQATAGF